MIRDLVYQGPPQIPETLDSDYLIFTVSFDGDAGRASCATSQPARPETRDAIFSHTVGFPGTRRRRRVRALDRLEHKRDNGYLVYAVAVRERAATSTRRCACRRASASSSSAPRELSDAELQAAFRALMAGGK